MAPEAEEAPEHWLLRVEAVSFEAAMLAGLQKPRSALHSVDAFAA